MSRHVFVGGLHRTGTSLVARWLAAHPDVTGFARTGVWEDEGQHLQDVLPAARTLGGPGRFAFHQDAWQGPVAEDAVADMRAQLLACWEPLWGTGAWRVEKSPPNLVRSRLLRQLFPEARFVFTTRHPLAVALATRRMSRRLRVRSVAELVRHWCVGEERLREDLVELGGVHVQVRLEELTRDPNVMSGVFELLGLEAVGAPEPLRRDPNARYRAAVLPRIERRWPPLRGELRALAPRVSALGYDLFSIP